MRISDIEVGKFYRATLAGDHGITPGTIIVGTQNDFVHVHEAESMDDDDYTLAAVVVWDPTGRYEPGYTIYRCWSGLDVEPVNFQFDGMTP